MSLADLPLVELNRRWLAHWDASPLFRYHEGRPGSGGMSEGQERFHRAKDPATPRPARYRALRAATQMGKPRAGAAEAGLRGTTRDEAGELLLGDVVTRAAEREIRSADDLMTIIEERKPGDSLVLLVLRDGEARRVAVTLSAAP